MNRSGHSPEQIADISQSTRALGYGVAEPFADALAGRLPVAEITEHSMIAIFAGAASDYSLPLGEERWRWSQVDQASAHSSVTTVEDRFLAGGCRSWMLRSLAQSKPDLLTRRRVRALATEIRSAVGTLDELMGQAGFSQKR